MNPPIALVEASISTVDPNVIDNGRGGAPIARRQENSHLFSPTVEPINNTGYRGVVEAIIGQEIQKSGRCRLIG